ncbi:hypothetical protein F4804DRAFT_99596 [Jackrogersella minutella]|nr:hypothetical protein F4804DRAFT_99596 [Jackrogersella minutella]
MTTPVSGSSLPQARDVHQHNHFHNSKDSHGPHYHHTHHNHQHVRSENSNTSKGGHKRTDSDSDPTIIIETVSVLQIIDSSGATITLQTLTPSTPIPATTVNPGSDTTVDPGTGSVSALTYPTTTSATTSDDEGDDLPSNTSNSTIDPTVAPSESSMPTSFPTLSYSPLTSTPLSGSPGFPSLAGVTNTTQASSTSLFPNSTSTSSSSVISFSAESIISSSISVLASSSSFSSSSSDSSTPATTTTDSPSPSASASSTTSGSFYGSATATSTGTGDGNVGVGGNAQPSASSTSTAAASDSSSSDGPGAATVAGSVLGGVAALAFLLVLVLFLLKWKKRQNTKQLMRGSTGERSAGGGLVENSGPSGGAGGGESAMSEPRRSVPFAIPAALASLTGYKRFSSSGRSGASSDGGERGFSKVSGRKLPPVIQFGGDGYSDPRDTILSDQSIEYRDSQAFPGLRNMGPTRLAVGAPMRPDSGIPVYNPGPARTPVTEQAPFSPYTDTLPLEPPPKDPLGRSRPSQDGSHRSHASASRFTEVL